MRGTLGRPGRGRRGDRRGGGGSKQRYKLLRGARYRSKRGERCVRGPQRVHSRSLLFADDDLRCSSDNGGGEMRPGRRRAARYADALQCGVYRDHHVCNGCHPRPDGSLARLPRKGRWRRRPAVAIATAHSTHSSFSPSPHLPFSVLASSSAGSPKSALCRSTAF